MSRPVRAMIGVVAGAGLISAGLGGAALGVGLRFGLWAGLVTLGVAVVVAGGAVILGFATVYDVDEPPAPPPARPMTRLPDQFPRDAVSL